MELNLCKCQQEVATAARVITLLVIEQDDGPLFKAHAEEFLAISRVRLALARWLHGNDQLEDNNDVKDQIQNFTSKFKILFMAKLKREINLALNDEVFLAFEVFNVKSKMTLKEQKESITTLVNFYDTVKNSTFKDETVTLMVY